MSAKLRFRHSRVRTEDGVQANVAVLALLSGQPVVAGSVQASGSNTDYDFGVARLKNDLIFANNFGSTPQDD